LARVSPIQRLGGAAPPIRCQRKKPKRLPHSMSSNSSPGAARNWGRWGPGYRTPTKFRNANGVIQYDWDEAAGQQGLEAACRFISAHDGQAHGRVRGMLYPLQVDTCSRELLQATRQAADSLHVPAQIHTGQNLMEFHQTLRKYRRTPVELLDETG